MGFVIWLMVIVIDIYLNVYIIIYIWKCRVVFFIIVKIEINIMFFIGWINIFSEWMFLCIFGKEICVL